jgi:hypothetical protein
LCNIEKYEIRLNVRTKKRSNGHLMIKQKQKVTLN